MITVNEEKCAGCGMCEVFCPVAAVKLWGYAKVDSSLCTECLICVETCPGEALTFEQSESDSAQGVF